LKKHKEKPSVFKKPRKDTKTPRKNHEEPQDTQKIIFYDLNILLYFCGKIIL